MVPCREQLGILLVSVGVFGTIDTSLVTSLRIKRLPLSPRLENNRSLFLKSGAGGEHKWWLRVENVKVKQDIAPPTVAIILAAEGKTDMLGCKYSTSVV